MRRLGVRIPSIVYTADDAPEVKARYFAAGVAAYLCKPIAGDDLIAVIERIMTRPHPASVDQSPTATPSRRL